MKQLAELFVLTLGADLPFYLLAIPVFGLADILGGALLGEMKDEFEWNILFKGITKFFGIYAMLFLIVIGGGLVDTQLFVVAGESVNVVEVLNIGLLLVVGKYAFEGIVKVFKLFGVAINIEQKEREEEVNE